MLLVWAQWADWAYHWPTLFFADFLRTFTTLSVHYDAPLGPNVDRLADLKTSTEPTFPLFVTCVGPVGRLGIPLACPIFCGCFETIHDTLSALPCPLGPNVDRWAALKTSAEPTFPVFVTCVGPVGRLGIPLACPVFLRMFCDHSRPFQCNALAPRAKCEWLGRPENVHRTHISP